MDLTYERTEYFDGESSKALEIARNTFLPHGFEIIENDESSIEVAKHGFLIISSQNKLNPIDLISNVRVSIDNRKITLYADLNGVKKFILYAGLFIAGMAVFFLALFGFIFVVKQNQPISKIILLSLAPLAPWPFLIPIMGAWYKKSVIKALDTLMNNMLILSKS